MGRVPHRLLRLLVGVEPPLEARKVVRHQPEVLVHAVELDQLVTCAEVVTC